MVPRRFSRLEENKRSLKMGSKDKWGDFDLLSGAKVNMMRISEVPVNYKERGRGNKNDEYNI